MPTQMLTDPSKRFVLLDNAPAAPGCCAFFRTSDEEWFIDTRMNDQSLPGHRGAVYIGATAFTEMAGLAGFLSPKQHKELSAYAQGAEVRIHELESELEKWRQVFDELDRIGLLGDAMRSRLGDLLNSGVENLPTGQLALDDAAESEPVSDESVDEQGTDDTSSAATTKPRRSRSKSSGAF